MARLLLNLRQVPDDEAAEVRELLREHGIEFYETRPSLFGISAGGIWLRQDADLPRARAELDRYQASRSARAREGFARARAEGRVPGVLEQLRREPLRVLLVLAGVLLMLGLTALPVVLLMRG
jgi:hypothetical protein